MDWRVIPPWAVPPRLDVLLFAAGVGAILHCYSDGHGRHRGVFKSKYLNVLDLVMGNAGGWSGGFWLQVNYCIKYCGREGSYCNRISA
jgi:hypothetical protein